MFGIIEAIYDFATYWVLGPALVSYGAYIGSAKYLKHRKATIKAKTQKFISSTGLSRHINIGTIRSQNQWGKSEYLSVGMNIKTLLDDNLETVIRREAEDITLTIHNKMLNFKKYMGGYHQTVTSKEDITYSLSHEEAEELQRVLCHATLEKQAVR